MLATRSLVRQLFWPGLSTAIMLTLALSLGVWQVHRLAWKTNLLAEIDRGEASPAIPLPTDPAPFAKVRVEGLLRQDLPALYGVEVRSTQAGPALGAFLLNPLERTGADPIMVDRGWVPDNVPRDTTPIVATVDGYVRPPEQSVRFGAANDPAAHRFYALDPAAIGDSLGLHRVAPFTLVALGDASPGNYPEPAQTLPRPANNHLVYAFTWFGLAAVLTAIFGVYAGKLLKARP